MSRGRKPLEVIDIDNDDEFILESQTPKKIDFTVTRKKGQTPKKRGIFTPLKISSDIKPKVEPESPSVKNTMPIVTLRATKSKASVQPKVEPDLDEAVAEGSSELGAGAAATALKTGESAGKDIKPDITALESLLDGLNLEHQATASASAVPKSIPSPSPSPKRDARASAGDASSTPLFLPFDSPDPSPCSASLGFPPQSEGSLTCDSPRYRAPTNRTSASHCTPSTTKTDLLDLFASDSPPPPPRRVRSLSASSSSSLPRSTTGYSDSEHESPVPDPSRSALSTKKEDIRGQSYSLSSRSVSPTESSMGEAVKHTDVKPDLYSLQITDVKPTIDKLPTTTPTSKPRRRAFLEFLDTVAKEDEPEDEYEYHLDESEGSLKDFIVDDDEVSFLSDSEGSHRERFESEEENSDIVELKVDRPTQIDDSDADSDILIEEAVSHPKIGRVSGLNFLEFEESDQDLPDVESDTEDLLDAVDDLTIVGRPAGKGKATAKKGVKTPKWAIERVRIAQEVFDDLDKRVFDGQLGPDGAGAKIIWNKRLLTTAGTAQRKRRRHPGGESSWDMAIQLSEKVCTGEEQVLSTVAHEMCHLACWVIDKEFKNPHGKIFKSWGRKVMRKRSDLEVTTKHDYVIEYKYHWSCKDCKKVYKRHSKSIDIEKQGCGVCKGKLEPLFETKQRGTSTFQVYLKQNMKTAKAALPGSSHGEVMRALSARWNEAGAEADHEAHWKAVLAASRS